VRDLRAVRGEMMLVESADITLSRPIRLLHPRFPCYIVPRGEGRFMIGATMIESARSGPITARALMELLSAAYALHPAFAEAVLLETGTGLRPAFADNLPALRFEGPDAEATQTGTDMGRIHLNGLYRHGFLMAPILAERLASQLAAGVLSYGVH
jgi:glycine oxidase